MKLKINRFRAAVVIVTLSAFAGAPAFAATLTATPASVRDVLSDAKGGDTIVLSKAVYTQVSVYNLNPTTAITIDARAATVHYMPFENSSNITLLGGAFGPSTYATVTFINSHNLTLQGGVFTNPGTAAVGITSSQHINVVGTTITGSLGDGIDIAASQYVYVQGNACLDNIQTAIHPDCVQMWSIPGKPPVSHITITGNRARGNTQGFDLFDHGTGGGSYIDVDHNVICTTYVWAGQVNGVTKSTMTNNVAYTLPGAVAQWAPPTWQINLVSVDKLGHIFSYGNVFANNFNGVTPNPSGSYPPCPV
jgi:hypothetical protein